MSIKDLLTKVEERVEALLRQVPETRDNDLLLQWLYLVQFEELQLPPLPNKLLRDQPSIMETVRRSRQKIQNTRKLYPPTREEVAKKRGWAQDDWKEYYGRS